MKKPILLFALSVVLFGCKDDSPAPDNSLVGTWDWVSTSGGIAGITYTPETEHYSSELLIGAEYTYTLYKADTLAFESTYVLPATTPAGYPDDYHYIHIGDGEYFYAYYVKGDFLYIADVFPDGFATVYHRHGAPLPQPEILK